MNGEIRVAADDDCFDFTHEEALAPDQRKRPILNAVAFGSDLNLFDAELGELAL